MTTGPQFIVFFFYFMIYWGDLPKVRRFFSSHFSNPPLISSYTISAQASLGRTWPRPAGPDVIGSWDGSGPQGPGFVSVCAVEQDSPSSSPSSLSYFLSLETKTLTEAHVSEEEGEMEICYQSLSSCPSSTSQDAVTEAHGIFLWYPGNCLLKY